MHHFIESSGTERNASFYRIFWDMHHFIESSETEMHHFIESSGTEMHHFIESSETEMHHFNRIFWYINAMFYRNSI